MNKNAPKSFFIILFLYMVGICLVSGCSSDSGSTPSDAGDTGMITVAISQGGQQAAPPYRMKVADVGEVTLTSVKIVMDDFKLVGADNDSLTAFEDTAVIQEIDLAGEPQDLATIEVSPTTVTKALFFFKKLLANDGDVYTDNPDMQDISIRVEGYVNEDEDSSFVWTSVLTTMQSLTFDAVTVNAGDSVVLDLNFCVDQWFLDDTDNYLDPREGIAAGLTRTTIELNIREALNIIPRD